MAEPEYEDIRRQLGSVDNSPWTLSRRRFIQASMAVGGAATLLPGWMQDIFASATPVGANEGILVLIMMGGGNDGLNMVPPIGDNAYYGLRPTLAIPADKALSIGSGKGLHPALSTVKSYWDLGKVAVVQGVGVLPTPDLSHFTSMANWMMGSASPNGTGWIGRYLDENGSDPMKAITLGTNVPLHLIGNTIRGIGLPDSIGGALGVDQRNEYDRREYQCIRDMAGGSTGLGVFGDQIANLGKQTIDLGATISPAYAATRSGGNLARRMGLAAQLININLGVRVFNVEYSGFDNHSNQAGDHNQRMVELDEAVTAFFAALAPEYLNRVTIMTFSEFGRRPKANDSQGTDHGTASNLLIIGNRVKGGIYGAQPSLTSLDNTSNLVANTDFRTVYSSVLQDWMHADANSILGADYGNLGIFNSVGDPAGGIPATGNIPSIADSGYWLVTQSGSVDHFGNAGDIGTPGPGSPVVGAAGTPSHKGMFIVRSDGKVHAHGDAVHKGDMSGKPLAAPMVGIAIVPAGNGYLLVGADGGVFNFGEAKFFGSTGAMRLNSPIVGIASTKSGKGYWLVAADGGVFSFGDAVFHGSMGATKLNQPVVGMARSGGGGGYWLVAADGGIFSFGDAPFYGSTGDLKLNQPIRGIVPSPTGKGYMFVAADGGVFTYGDAKFQGSSGGGTATSPVVALAG